MFNIFLVLIDSEVNHKRHFIKIPFINKGVEFIDIHSIFKDNLVISSVSGLINHDVPRSTSYGVYISQLIRFARASSFVTDFNTRNKLLTQKLL